MRQLHCSWWQASRSRQLRRMCVVALTLTKAGSCIVQVLCSCIAQSSALTIDRTLSACTQAHFMLLIALVSYCMLGEQEECQAEAGNFACIIVAVKLFRDDSNT